MISKYIICLKFVTLSISDKKQSISFWQYETTLKQTCHDSTFDVFLRVWVWGHLLTQIDIVAGILDEFLIATSQIWIIYIICELLHEFSQSSCERTLSHVLPYFSQIFYAVGESVLYHPENRFRSWPMQMAYPSHLHTNKHECSQGIHITISTYRFYWTKHNNLTLNPDKEPILCSLQTRRNIRAIWTSK